MSKVVIYQVLGELKNYEERNYEIYEENGTKKSVKCKLSSCALKEYYGEQAEMVFIYPLSLYENITNIKNNIRENLQDIQKYGANRLNEIIAPQKITPDNILVVESVGCNVNNVTFEGYLDNIMLTIYSDMIKKFYKKEVSAIIANISTGHNIYTFPLTEALEYFCVFYKMWNGFNDSSPIKIAFEGVPFKEGSDVFVKIYLQEIDYRVFFDNPLKTYTDFHQAIKIEGWLHGLEDNKKENIRRRYNLFSKELEKLISDFFVLFNAIKFATPLYIYYFLHQQNSQTLYKPDEILQKLIEITEELLLKAKENKPYSFYEIDKKIVKNIIFLIAMYKGMLTILKEINIISLSNPEEGVPIDELKKFCYLYKTKGIGLETNERFLNREISEIEKIQNSIAYEWQTYSRIKGGEETIPSADSKRNFYAHCGFEQNFIQMKVKDGKVYIRYKPEAISQICGYLEKPV